MVKDKEDPVYELAKEFFLKRAPGMFINEKSLNGFEAEAENAIRMAKFFIEKYDALNNSGK